MLEQVEKKIEELKKTQAAEYYKKKDADLEAWGLASKKENGKRIPIIVTNDEYEALIKASNGVGDVSRNKVSGILNTACVAVLAGGLVCAVALFSISNLGMIYASIAVALTIIFALIMKGLAEAIKLLQQIIDTRPIETPEISEEEFKAQKNTKKAVPEQYDMNQYQQYAPTQPVAPAQQPPVYHAQPQQAQPVQAYPGQGYQFPTGTVMASEIEIENTQISSAPQQF